MKFKKPKKFNVTMEEEHWKLFSEFGISRGQGAVTVMREILLNWLFENLEMVKNSINAIELNEAVRRHKAKLKKK